MSLGAGNASCSSWPSPRRTAQRLGIHENTVANRVRAATDLLGRPLNRRVPETIVALRLTALLG